MAIKRVSISRAQWLFSGQCLPAGARTDTIAGLAAQRCTLLNIPACVAIAISGRSEVRAISVGAPGAAWPAAMIKLVEGAPQIFSWAGGLVDLVKLDWTDGRLEIECAETPEDIAGLSVFVAPFAAVAIEGFDTAAAVLNVHMQCPRISSGIVQAIGVATRVGGIDTAFTRRGIRQTADGLATQNPPGGPASGLTMANTPVITVTETLCTAGVSNTGLTARDAVLHSMAIGGGTIYANLGLRGA